MLARRERDHPSGTGPPTGDGRRPAHEKGERPEAEQRQVVRLHRPPDHLGHEIVDRRERQRREEQAEHVVPVPPVHRRFLDANVQPGNVRDEIENREPEQRGTHVPHGNVEMVHAPALQRGHQRQRDQRASGGEKQPDLPRDLEPLPPVEKPTAIAPGPRSIQRSRPLRRSRRTHRASAKS